MIIDFHTHVFPPFLRDDRSAFSHPEPAYESIYRSPKAKLAGVRELISNMDEGGVDRSVIFGFPWEKAENYQRHNDYIIEAVQRYPDRLIGFCCFSPMAPGGPEEAERCLKAGLSGVGELAVYGSGLSLDAVRALKDVMELCSGLDVPFLLHANEPVGHQYAGKAPMTLAQIYGFLKAYPKNRIILAHWGGGLFFYALMKKEVREVLKNVWFDTAASPFLYAPDIYRFAGEIIGVEKILFGTDYPLLKPERYINEIESTGIAEGAMEQIMGLNAQEVLGIV
jgi:predicted TIM-barrel fold metal-dependent hydrolase